MVRYHLGAVVVKVRIEGLSGSVGRVVGGEAFRSGIYLREMLMRFAEGLAVGSGFIAPWFLQVVKCF